MTVELRKYNFDTINRRSHINYKLSSPLTSILGMEKLDSRACANQVSLCCESGGPHFGRDALGHPNPEWRLNKILCEEPYIYEMKSVTEGEDFISVREDNDVQRTELSGMKIEIKNSNLSPPSINTYIKKRKSFIIPNNSEIRSPLFSQHENFPLSTFLMTTENILDDEIRIKELSEKRSFSRSALHSRVDVLRTTEGGSRLRASLADPYETPDSTTNDRECLPNQTLLAEENLLTTKVEDRSCLSGKIEKSLRSSIRKKTIIPLKDKKNVTFSNSNFICFIDNRLTLLLENNVNEIWYNTVDFMYIKKSAEIELYLFKLNNPRHIKDKFFVKYLWSGTNYEEYKQNTIVNSITTFCRNNIMKKFRNNI